MPTPNIDLRTNILIEETVRFLASNDEDLKKFDDKDFLAWDFIELSGLIASKNRNVSSILLKIWAIYQKTKKRGQEMSGELLAKILGKIGGRKFCKKTDYCNSKSSLKYLFEFSDSPEGTTLFAKGIEEAMQSEYAESIESLAKFIGGAAEELADNTVPLSFIFLSIKSGIDQLCHCCSGCGGAGTTKQKPCTQCKGSGVNLEITEK